MSIIDIKWRYTIISDKMQIYDYFRKASFDHDMLGL